MWPANYKNRWVTFSNLIYSGCKFTHRQFVIAKISLLPPLGNTSNVKVVVELVCIQWKQHFATPLLLLLLSFGSHVISGSKSIWLRWKFSISLAWSNGALLTGGGNRKSFRPSSSHTLKGVAESCSERGRWRRREGAKETREERKMAGVEILMRDSSWEKEEH